MATFYVFSSCDMHYDNMISCGEYPFFFDVETLVTGRMDNDMILPKSINNSILSTNVLPISVDSVALDINMSALFTGRHQSKRGRGLLCANENGKGYHFPDFLRVE